MRNFKLYSCLLSKWDCSQYETIPGWKLKWYEYRKEFGIVPINCSSMTLTLRDISYLLSHVPVYCNALKFVFICNQVKSNIFTLFRLRFAPNNRCAWRAEYSKQLHFRSKDLSDWLRLKVRLMFFLKTALQLSTFPIWIYYNQKITVNLPISNWK